MTVVPLTPTHQAVSVLYDGDMTEYLRGLCIKIGAALTRAGYDLPGITPNMIYQASTVQTRELSDINGTRITMRFPATGNPDADRSIGPDPRGDVELVGGARDGEVLRGTITTLTRPILYVTPISPRTPAPHDQNQPVLGPSALEYHRAGYDLHNQRWTYQLHKDTAL